MSGAVYISWQNKNNIKNKYERYLAKLVDTTLVWLRQYYLMF